VAHVRSTGFSRLIQQLPLLSLKLRRRVEEKIASDRPTLSQTDREKE
jgi:hypothetical protein